MTDQQRSRKLLSGMSIEQKINLLNGAGIELSGSGSDRVPGAAGSTCAVPELAIPAIVLADGPAGLRINPTRANDQRTYYATAFPVATALASSWNIELAEQVGRAMGREAKEYGVDLLLAPALNIQLNPLGGRNFEYYSEDPLLGGSMAAAVVSGIQSQGVGATIKHFVANQVETSRMVLNAEIGEQALREIYLKGFEIAVKSSQPRAVMSSYNQVNGTYTSQSEALLSAILRDEWGFAGLVMTDWFAGDDSAAQVRAGNDLIMPGTATNRRQIAEALAEGRLSEAELDRNLARILAGIFQSPTMNNYACSNQPDLDTNAAIAREAAAEGVVLLKNAGNTLPLRQARSIATFGNTSFDFISGGTGSGDVNEAYTVSLVDALLANDFVIDQSLQADYLEYARAQKAKQPERSGFFQFVPPIPERPVAAARVEQLALSHDIALLTLGRNSGEFQDRQVEDDFYLTDTEQRVIDTVSKAFHEQGKRVVVILNIGNVIETDSWKDKVDAIVLPWQGGQEAGNAVVDVLTGKVNPSGKLAVTFPVKYEQIPSARTFPGTVIDPEVIPNPYLSVLPSGQRTEIQYLEGIYVGYRFFDSFAEPVSYPFGHGLSYSDFAISDVKLETRPEGHYQVSLQVSNNGRTAGKQVVQLYVAAPQGAIPKANQTLQAFAKTRLLQVGESELMTLQLSTENLASFDAQRHQWVAEAGQYKLYLGLSSRDIIWQQSLGLDTERVLSAALTPLPTSKPLDQLSG